MSSNDLIELFDTEFIKLENLVNEIILENELPVNQIVSIYYQITNVTSMIEVMKQQIDNSDSSFREKIFNAENFISKKFNYIIHPKIMVNITNSISTITENLQSLNSEQKSKETIENEAKII